MNSHYLLTGIPGAIGDYLLKRLISKNRRAFFSILTPKQSVAKTKAIVDKLCEETSFARTQIAIIPADIGDPSLGMDAERYETLRTSITHLIHGHYADLTGNKEDGVAINVYGTENLIFLAKHSKCLQHFLYISSLFISGDYPQPFGEEDFDLNQGFHNWFEKTRYVGEESVRSEMNRIPTSILRIGMLVGDSSSGEISQATPFYGLMDYCLRFARVPGLLAALGSDNPLPITPIDHLAEVALGALERQDASSGKVFHVFDQQSLPSYQLFQEVCKNLTNRDPQRKASRRLWKGLLTLGGSRVFGINKHFFAYLYRGNSYLAQHTRDLLGDSVIRRESPIDYLPRLCQYYRSHQVNK